MNYNVIKELSTMYTKFFIKEESARRFCRMKNESTIKHGRYTIYCLVTGPNDNFAVVDLSTAIDLGNGYEVV